MAGTQTRVPAGAPVVPQVITSREARPVGDRGAVRRRVAYVFLIGYALLMFVPFAWTVITSFKTVPIPCSSR